jgi:uncharacterized protein
MTRQYPAKSLNIQALAESGERLSGVVPLQKLERLALESKGLQADTAVNWQTVAELRLGLTGSTDVWLHLQASASVPLACQRCLGAFQAPLQVNQWYRFVASEDIAMAEDDEADEDLLVMAPQFDLLGLLEDELLMALPLVPMHDECPVLPAFSAGGLDAPGADADKPNPFAALAKLKKS